MQFNVKLFAISLAAAVSAVFAIQDGSVHMQLAVPSSKSNASPFQGFMERGLTNLGNSLFSMLDETVILEKPSVAHDLHVEEQKADIQKVPEGRKGMYFRPVSVTLQCVMTLTVISMLIYTLLSMSRNYDELSASFTQSLATQCLTIASRVASFAPMLCMLFVGCRMFVLATTEGLGEPPVWVKSCMWTAVFGVILQLGVVLALPLYAMRHGGADEAAYDMTEGKMSAWEATHIVQHDDTKPPTEVEVALDIEFGDGQAEPVEDATGDRNDAHPNLTAIQLRKDSQHLHAVFEIVQVVAIVLIYGSVVGVITGIYTFPAQTTQISAAVKCTVNLSILYFGVCFTLWLARAISEVDSGLTKAALAMSSVTRKAPMFCVLFLASRMRALQLDPPHGMPPFWMQCCFFGITGFICLETIAAAYVGSTGDLEKGYYGAYLFHCHNKGAQIVQHGAAIITYAFLFPVVYGVYMMKGPDGLPAPLSTTLSCVVTFTAIYFSIMFAQDLIMFLEELEDPDEDGDEVVVADVVTDEQKMAEGPGTLRILRDSALAAGISLSLSPLLCILFVATRMRALQITQQQGDPPGWAQDCMMIAVFATCVQALCCLLMPIFIGKATDVDDDGNPNYDLQPMVGAYAVAMVKYVALIFLHGSVVAICVAVFVMTPETANSSGRFITSRRHLLKALAGTLVVFAIALLFSSAKVIGMGIKWVIESVDQELLGVDIEVEKVALSLFKGYVHVKKLKVLNPEFEMTWAKDAAGKMVGTPVLGPDGEQVKCDWESKYIAKIDLVLVKINVGRILSSCGHEFELENLSLKGVHANVEKPNMDLHAKNTNIEYVINFLDSKGLLPPPEEAKAEPKPEPEPEKNSETDTKPEPEPVKTPEEEEELPLVIIHKICFGDIGAGVILRNVKGIGTINFHPTIPLVEFEDVQQDIFGGKEDLKPPEMVACIITALGKHVFNVVVHKIPEHLAAAVSGAVLAAAEKITDTADMALRKMPCYTEEKRD